MVKYMQYFVYKLNKEQQVLHNLHKLYKEQNVYYSLCEAQNFNHILLAKVSYRKVTMKKATCN